MYGRREAFKVHQGLRDKGPVKVPREFVFMDRAAIGLGGVFLHLDAELNFHRLFEDTIAGADLADVAERQRDGIHASRRAAAGGRSLRQTGFIGLLGVVALVAGAAPLAAKDDSETSLLDVVVGDYAVVGQEPDGDGPIRARPRLSPGKAASH